MSLASHTDFSIREMFCQYSTEMQSPPHGTPKQLFHVDQPQPHLRPDRDLIQFTTDQAYASLLPNKLVRPPSTSSIQSVHPYAKEQFGVPSTEQFGVPSTSNQLGVQPDARHQFSTPPTTEEKGQFDKPSISPDQSEATYSRQSCVEENIQKYPSTSNQLGGIAGRETSVQHSSNN